MPDPVETAAKETADAAVSTAEAAEVVADAAADVVEAAADIEDEEEITLSEVNAKLDRVLELLEPEAEELPEGVESVAVETVVPVVAEVAVESAPEPKVEKARKRRLV